MKTMPNLWFPNYGWAFKNLEAKAALHYREFTMQAHGQSKICGEFQLTLKIFDISSGILGEELTLSRTSVFLYVLCDHLYKPPKVLK